MPAPTRRAARVASKAVLRVIAKAGGSVWESNPPDPTQSGHTGFEDQGSHQTPSTPSPVHASTTRGFDDDPTWPISTPAGTRTRYSASRSEETATSNPPEV